MNRRLLAVPILGVSLALAACNSGHHSASSITHPTSSAVASAEADATKVVVKCRPAGMSASAWELKWATSFKPTLAAFETCEKIPAPKRTAFYTCLLNAVKSAAKTLGKAAREAAFLAGANACVTTAQQ